MGCGDGVNRKYLDIYEGKLRRKTFVNYKVLAYRLWETLRGEYAGNLENDMTRYQTIIVFLYFSVTWTKSLKNF